MLYYPPYDGNPNHLGTTISSKIYQLPHFKPYKMVITAPIIVTASMAIDNLMQLSLLYDEFIIESIISCTMIG